MVAPRDAGVVFAPLTRAVSQWPVGSSWQRGGTEHCFSQVPFPAQPLAAAASSTLATPFAATLTRRAPPSASARIEFQVRWFEREYEYEYVEEARRASNRETPSVYTVYKYLYKLGLLASGGGRERSGEARAASLRGAPHRSRTPPGASSTRCQTGNPRWIGSSRAPRARLVCSDTRLIISRRNCHRSVSLCKILRPSASLRARP